MDYSLISLDKPEFLERMNELSLDKLWENFLILQVDIFFEKELAIFSNETWWKNASNVLEIGSGSGYFCFKLSETRNEKHYLGIDKKSEYIQYAKEHYASNQLTFQEGDGEVFIRELANRFDVGIFRMTLQHLKDPMSALSHVFRYLKPNGHVIIIDSYDSLRECSYNTPYLDIAVKELNLQNQKTKKGNRIASLEMQRNIYNQVNFLSKCYAVGDSNLRETGEFNHDSQELIVHSYNMGDSYFFYNLLFLQLLKKGWNIEVNFDKAYDEAKYFLDNEGSWYRPGTHYLILKRKNSSEC